MTKTKKKFKSLSFSSLVLFSYSFLEFSSIRIVFIEYSNINLESECNNGNRIILIETLITNITYSFCQEQSLRDSIPFEMERSLYRFRKVSCAILVIRVLKKMATWVHDTSE